MTENSFEVILGTISNYNKQKLLLTRNKSQNLVENINKEFPSKIKFVLLTLKNPNYTIQFNVVTFRKFNNQL